MGASELAEWRAFWAREPWGPYRDNYHAAMLCALFANAFRDPKKRPKGFTFDDFMLADRDKHRAKQTAEFINFLTAVAKPKKGNSGK
jgi:hypothetical protein